METELLRFKKLPSLNISRNSSSVRDNCSSNSDIDDERRSYTSLKDILLSSPQTSHTNNHEGSCDFDSSNITIKNKLVKRAASAYVQSATILAARNQNYFVSVWGRIGTTCSYSCWNLYVRNPLHACFNPIYKFLASTVGAVWNTMTRIS